jgi:hypothetical protein
MRARCGVRERGVNHVGRERHHRQLREARTKENAKPRGKRSTLNRKLMVDAVLLDARHEQLLCLCVRGHDSQHDEERQPYR